MISSQKSGAAAKKYKIIQTIIEIVFTSQPSEGKTECSLTTVASGNEYLITDSFLKQSYTWFYKSFNRILQPANYYLLFYKKQVSRLACITKKLQCQYRINREKNGSLSQLLNETTSEELVNNNIISTEPCLYGQKDFWKKELCPRV